MHESKQVANDETEFIDGNEKLSIVVVFDPDEGFPKRTLIYLERGSE
ncbi:MAG: hypothetical protein WCF63_01360 [Acidimicrobiales bacterium]